MSLAPVLANIDRAGDHGLLLGIVLVIALFGGLIYGLVHVLRNRAGRTRADRDPEIDRGPRP